jgi:SAM-dependent methyltransferase
MFSSCFMLFNGGSQKKTLPVKKSKIPKHVAEAAARNYEENRKINLSVFPYGGTVEDYELGYLNWSGTPCKMVATVSNLVTDLLKKFPDQTLHGLDLGCGKGNVLININRKFPQVKFIGITAENPAEKNLPDCVIQANIEEMTDLVQLKKKKFHLIISSQTMFYLCNPIKTIYEAYEMLEDGGFLFLDTISLLRFNKENKNFGEALMRALVQDGHEIIWGKSQSTSILPKEDWGTNWIFLKKNAQLKLQFPLHYGKITTSSQIISGPTTYDLQAPRARYLPNPELIKLAENIRLLSPLEHEEMVIKQLIKWGLTTSIYKKTYPDGLHSVAAPYPADFDFSQLYPRNSDESTRTSTHMKNEETACLKPR